MTEHSDNDKNTRGRYNIGSRKMYMGSGLPMHRKMDQILPITDMEYCRYSIHGGSVSEFEVPGNYSMLAFVRHRVYDFACNMGFTKDQLHDIVLAVGEAGTNAMQHGCLSPLSRIRIRMERHADSLHVFVSDDDSSFCFEDWRPVTSETMAESGRGIVCMEAMMDKVAFHPRSHGTCVELIKYLPLQI